MTQCAGFGLNLGFELALRKISLPTPARGMASDLFLIELFALQLRARWSRCLPATPFCQGEQTHRPAPVAG
jgi:hypothetical protein